MRQAPEIIEVDRTQREDVLRRVEQALDAKDAALIRAVFQSYAYVTDLVEDKNTSIRRLRELFFGKRTEKTAAVLGRETAKSEQPDAPGPNGATTDAVLASGEPARDEAKKPDADSAGEAKEADTDSTSAPPG